MKKLLLIISLLLSLSTIAQERKFTKLKVFVDCAFCDMTYLMQEMNYLNFVRNTDDADVYVMVTTQTTGGGGTGYTLKFTGQNQYEHIYNSIGFSILSTSTTAETRQQLADNLSLGLASFWSQLARTEFQLKKDKVAGLIVDTLETNDVEEKDAWNNWVFQLGVSGYMQGQKTSESSSYSANFSSKQVTEKHKFHC